MNRVRDNSYGTKIRFSNVMSIICLAISPTLAPMTSRASLLISKHSIAAILFKIHTLFAVNED